MTYLNWLQNCSDWGPSTPTTVVGGLRQVCVELLHVGGESLFLDSYILFMCMHTSFWIFHKFFTLILMTPTELC